MSVVGQESVMHQAWNLVMDEKATTIGILGPGGIGKTTLMKQLYKKLITTTKHFEFVAWITVSSKFTLEKVQDDISKGVGLFDVNWAGKSFDEKSQLIREEIRGKKFILFLDDLWFPVDLSKLGVEGSKLIYSTRLKMVTRQISAHTVFTLKKLSKEYVWELFVSKVGDQILTDPRIMEMARGLVNKCNGLPILISTLGRAMTRRKKHAEWQDALQQIEIGRQLWKEGEGNPILNFCFDALPNFLVKSCLLYFSLFPEDFTIRRNDLVDFWICEQLFSEFDAWEVALSLGYNAIDILIRAGFLEEENDCVKLLDTIRDFALSRVIKSQMFNNAQLLELPPVENGPKLTHDHKVFQKFARLFKGAPYSNKERTIESRETTGWISSMKNSTLHLVDVPTSLSTFLLNHNPFIMIKPMPRSSMYELTVLDLSNSGITEIPRVVSRLLSLQYLNVSHTWIEQLPVELEMLKGLKCLSLEYNDQLRVIPKQVISSLFSLQVLKMFRCGFSVEELENNILSATNMDISPLLCLEDLKVLSITITCVSALHKFFDNPKLSKCTQSLSIEVFWGLQSLDISLLAAMPNLSTLEIHQVENLKEFNWHYSKLPRKRSFELLREVTLEKCSSLQDSTWVILVPNLTILRVKGCEQIKELINRRQLDELVNKIFQGEVNFGAFANLEILSLDSLTELRRVCWRALPFQSLKKMKITDCSLLKKLPLDSTFTKANELVIEAEEDWWENVEWEDEAAKTTFLPCFRPLF